MGRFGVLTTEGRVVKGQSSTSSDRLYEVLDAVTRMRGCKDRGIAALEALAVHDGEDWPDLLATAKARATMPAHDFDGGRVVAWLEGYLVGRRI